MKAIKFNLDPGHTTIDHPGTLEFLHTDVQDTIVAWFLEDRSQPRTLTNIYIALTGEDLPPGFTKHLGSKQVLTPEPFVYHIFQQH